MRRRSRSSPRASRATLAAEVRTLRARVAELESTKRGAEDLHEELRAQSEQLAESRRPLEIAHERYLELFDFAPTGYVVHDENGVIVDLNLQGAVLLEVERSKMIGIPLVTQVAPADRRRLLAHLLQCRRGAPNVDTELTLQTRAGDEVPVQLSTRHGLRADGQRPCRYNTAIIDLRERRRSEEEQRRTEQHRQRIEREQLAAVASAAATDHFLAVLSHELRTPLAPVMLALETVKLNGHIPDALRPTFDLVRRNVQLEARLIDDLLDVTRIRQGKLRIERSTIDLHVLVEEVLSSSAPSVEGGSLRITFDPQARRPWILADALRIRQVLWNLVQNAIRNTPPGGRIVVRTANARPETITVGVSDSGRGMTPDLIGRLFKPFEQSPANRTGLGLGLSISRGLVEAHGGSLVASSPGLGHGSTFLMELLTTDPPPRGCAVPPPVAGLATERLSVLVVEDNDDNAVALVDLLELHGFSVRRADSVAAALRQADGDFDVVVSDLGLPDGSGIDLIRNLRARRPVKGIALSGYGTPRDVERSLEAGFALHLTKPVDPDDLVRAIRKVAS